MPFDCTQEEWDAWVASRPPMIRELIRKYPPGMYYVLPGAPYGFSAPGTIVELQGYRETGDVHVIVRAENKTPAVLEHERMMCEKYHKDFEEMRKKDVMVTIDPAWLGKIG